jgi:DNA-binding NarL/FixJ family response regulator
MKNGFPFGLWLVSDGTRNFHSASTIADAVEKAHQLAPDLILMDFSMPQMDGVQAAREIAKSGTDIPILLFTLNLSPQIMELAHNAGLRGRDFKVGNRQLPSAIKALQRGETFFYAS